MNDTMPVMPKLLITGLPAKPLIQRVQRTLISGLSRHAFTEPSSDWRVWRGRAVEDGCFGSPFNDVMLQAISFYLNLCQGSNFRHILAPSRLTQSEYRHVAE